MSSKKSLPPNAFIGSEKPPTAAELSAALGPAGVVWDELLVELAREFDVTIHEWKCHSPKWGWALRVLRGKHTIVWLSPSTGGFEALFILGERAMRAARAAKLPKAVAETLASAPQYPEGTGVRLKVKSSRNLGALKRLVAIKIAN